MEKIDNAVIQILKRAEWVDFKTLHRPIQRQAAFNSLLIERATHLKDTFRLRLENWDTNEVEYIV